MRATKKNPWILLMLILVGVVIGSFLGKFLGAYEMFAFLHFGQPFGIGLNNPFVLDIGIIQLSFALVFNINMLSIIGIIIAIVIFNKIG